MNWYITRVELHRATEADYQRLHQEMLDRRFYRTIQADSGEILHLPSAMYYSESDMLDASGVELLAYAAAAATGCAFWVFTCMTPQWAAHNLPRA